MTDYKALSAFKDYTFSDVMYMAATVWGEARGELFNGKVAVAWVIRNRQEKGGWYGNTLKEVCTKPYQFSCWNANDPNSHMVKDIAINWRVKPDDFLNDKVIQECIMAVLLCLRGKVADDTSDATHYHTNSIRPKWSKGKLSSAAIGNHVFYNDVD